MNNVEVLAFLIQKCEYETVSYMRIMIDHGFNPTVYKGLLQEVETGKRAYSLFVSFFVQFFSLYEFGASLCEDFQRALEDEKDKVSQ